MLTETRPKQHIVTALVQNEAGTINRLVSLFRRRGFSLASFNAGDCEDDGFSRLTLLVNAEDESTLGQCVKQLNKLIDVVECEDLSPDSSVSRELALIRLEPGAAQERALRVASDFGCLTPSISERMIVVEKSASPEEISEAIAALRPFNITEIVRTGLVAMKVEK